MVVHAGGCEKLVACRLAEVSGLGVMPDVASIQLGFLPLNHILGRMGILMCLSTGGYTVFVRSAPACMPLSRFISSNILLGATFLIWLSTGSHTAFMRACEHPPVPAFLGSPSCLQSMVWRHDLQPQLASRDIAVSSSLKLVHVSGVPQEAALGGAVTLSSERAGAQKRHVDLL